MNTKHHNAKLDIRDYLYISTFYDIFEKSQYFIIGKSSRNLNRLYYLTDVYNFDWEQIQIVEGSNEMVKRLEQFLLCFSNQANVEAGRIKKGIRKMCDHQETVEQLKVFLKKHNLKVEYLKDILKYPKRKPSDNCYRGLIKKDINRINRSAEREELVYFLNLHLSTFKILPCKETLEKVWPYDISAMLNKLNLQLPTRLEALEMVTKREYKVNDPGDPTSNFIGIYDNIRGAI